MLTYRTAAESAKRGKSQRRRAGQQGGRRGSRPSKISRDPPADKTSDRKNNNNSKRDDDDEIALRVGRMVMEAMREADGEGQNTPFGGEHEGKRRCWGGCAVGAFSNISPKLGAQNGNGVDCR